ncbi:GAF domain-containing protein [Yangia mangrovi]|uniref:GAF domain-containing protein n=1 Tax=Alloyangia mangrovi TaxID=1779329 RepID=A0A2A3JZQ0_9RHOB|nr:GAF domain-containing protein [Alloyangia mangrovi]MCA0941702.1 GAF domain-containing protein [Alloyangia pacifica]MCA0946920.1 GAF domain-containing protein [Alloyangia pacifica]MCT4371935.1 GAF domain-containing protein [Alloyangia mangrovi]
MTSPATRALDLAPLLRAQAQLNQPHTLFRAVEETCRQRFGFRFLTVLRNLPGTGNVMRMHSSEKDYPTGALKPMGLTDWGKVVLDAGEAWLGNSAEDVRWAFPDAELILSKGCEACACAPVLWAGRCVGVLSLNDARDAYSPDDMADMTLIAQTLAPALI